MKEITVVILDNELTPFVAGEPREIAKALNAGGLVELKSLDGSPAFIQAEKVCCVTRYTENEEKTDQ